MVLFIFVFVACSGYKSDRFTAKNDNNLQLEILHDDYIRKIINQNVIEKKDVTDDEIKKFKEKVQEDNKKYGAEVNVEKVEKGAKVIVTIDLNKITEEQAKEFLNDIKVKHKDGKALYKDIEENILKNKGIEKVKQEVIWNNY